MGPGLGPPPAYLGEAHFPADTNLGPVADVLLITNGRRGVDANDHIMTVDLAAVPVTSQVSAGADDCPCEAR